MIVALAFRLTGSLRFTATPNPIRLQIRRTEECVNIELVTANSQYARHSIFL